MSKHSNPAAAHVVNPRRRRETAASRFEWRVVDIPSAITRAEARSILTEQAEYGRWELARSQKFIGGARRVWLKRRVMRVERTDVF
ncbi:DUF5703 family protein [Demequina sp. NBRC 110057]|uniref:DUF5703 family protein n=1 Tax=Demequina sp. NBRC 110057 TaxID=1570346 RepID=UPI001F1A2076|nr:DUF5703 family protein [Demequina sp. NBRC 110057]